MRKFSVLAAFLCLAQLAFSQSSSVKGIIRDTSEKKELQNAVVALLQGNDSVLVKYVRSDKNGAFEIGGLKAGEYVMLVTFPKFADYADKISLQDGKDLDLGLLPLTLKSQLLQEVVIKSGAAIRMRGDTTEFTADSFHVREGATVEELLRVIPGMQVNSKGEITAQGKKVDKVLVDGEEFFGDDPTIATQNIGARAVDKVQVYDTRTEQDQLKGIGASGDGNKTINIKLKESAKKGYFGKIEGSTDLDRLNNAKFMLNKFKGSQKVSAYGTKSNISTGSLGWEERNKMGIESDYEYDEISGFGYSIGDNNSDFNNWNLRGIPDAYTLGGLYSNKWNEEKNKLNISYLHNRLGTRNTNYTIAQTLLADTSYYNNSVTRTRGLSQQHAVNGKYEWKIDSLASLKYSVAGSYRKKEEYSNYYGEALNEERELVNTNTRINDVNTTRKQLDNLITYKQLFLKKNRQLVATFRLGLLEEEQDGILAATARFFKDNSQEITDLQKINTGNSTTIGAKVTFNEPFTEKLNLVAEYSFNKNLSSSHRNSYDKDPEGKYSELNAEFSNNSDLNATSNSGTLLLRYMGKKLRLAGGTGVSAIQLDLHNLDLDVKSRYDFIRLTPQAQFRYLFKPQTGVSLNYRGSTIQPTLTQLQPLRNNNDNLSIYVGNPDLGVAFKHNISLFFNDYKVLTQQYTYVDAGISIIRNAIIYQSQVDLSTGKTTYTPVNVNGNYSYYLYANWNSGGGDKKLVHEVSPEANGGRTMSFLNGLENINNYLNLTLYYGVRYSSMEKFNFSIKPKLQRSLSRSSLNPAVKNNYWTYGGYADTWAALPWQLYIRSDVDANIRQKTSTFPGNEMIVWNARLMKKLLKSKALEVGVIAHDILNQNIGFQRIINSNYISEQRYDMLGRYFLLSATWTFSKMPGKN